VSIPRDTYEQWDAYQSNTITQSKAGPGDLAYCMWGEDGTPGPGHVQIVINQGATNTIEAASPGTVIEYSPPASDSKYVHVPGVGTTTGGSSGTATGSSSTTTTASVSGGESASGGAPGISSTFIAQVKSLGWAGGVPGATMGAGSLDKGSTTSTTSGGQPATSGGAPGSAGPALTGNGQFGPEKYPGFAAAVLADLGIQDPSNNAFNDMYLWERAEGGGSGPYNYLNLGPGWSYPSLSAGAEATAQNLLHEGSYGAIVADLQSGAVAAKFAYDVVHSHWGTSGGPTTIMAEAMGTGDPLGPVFSVGDPGAYALPSGSQPSAPGGITINVNLNGSMTFGGSGSGGSQQSAQEFADAVGAALSKDRRVQELAKG